MKSSTSIQSTFSTTGLPERAESCVSCDAFLLFRMYKCKICRISSLETSMSDAPCHAVIVDAQTARQRWHPTQYPTRLANKPTTQRPQERPHQPCHPAPSIRVRHSDATATINTTSPPTRPLAHHRLAPPRTGGQTVTRLAQCSRAVRRVGCVCVCVCAQPSAKRGRRRSPPYHSERSRLRDAPDRLQRPRRCGLRPAAGAAIPDCCVHLLRASPSISARRCRCAL